MKETYFYYLHKFKIQKINLINKIIKKKCIFLFDNYFIQIPINWKIKISLKKILVFKMSIFQKLFLPFSIITQNLIIADKSGNGRIFNYVISIIERNKNFTTMRHLINNSLTLIVNSDVFYQIYKSLLFFSTELVNLLFMFIDFSFNMNNCSMIFNSKAIFTIPKYIFIMYMLNEYSLKLFQAFYNPENTKKILIIVKKIFNKNTRCKIILFTYKFCVSEYYLNKIPYKNKFYKFYTFKNSCKIQNMHLYFSYINRINWLNLVLSVVKINPSIRLLIIFQSKEEAEWLYSIIRKIFNRKILLYTSKKDLINYKMLDSALPMNDNNVLIITDSKFMDKMFEIKLDWVLCLISGYDLGYENLLKNMKKIKFFKKTSNILLIISVEKNKKKTVHYLQLFKIHNFKNFILLNFSMLMNLVQKKKIIRKKINMFLKYAIFIIIRSNNYAFYEMLQKMLTCLS